MTLMTASAAAIAVAPSAASPIAPQDRAAALIRAAGRLLPDLERGRAIDARLLRAAMEAAFGGVDAEGAWAWKDAYEACEAAQVLFVRKYGPAMRASAGSPAAMLAMLAKVAALLPSKTRRSKGSRCCGWSRRGCRSRRSRWRRMLRQAPSR